MCCVNISCTVRARQPREPTPSPWFYWTLICGTGYPETMRSLCSPLPIRGASNKELWSLFFHNLTRSFPGKPILPIFGLRLLSNKCPFVYKDVGERRHHWTTPKASLTQVQDAIAGPVPAPALQLLVLCVLKPTVVKHHADDALEYRQ